MLTRQFVVVTVLALATVAALWAQSASRPILTGKVVAVADGDTLTILTADKRQVKIRLEGIDAPESGQPFGTKAKVALSAKVFDKAVTVEDMGPDKYGRTLGMVSVAGSDVNLALVTEGFAWHFTRYSTDPKLAAAERVARQAKRGLWVDKSPVAPWDWRAAQRAKSNVPVGQHKVVPNGLEIVGLLPNPQGDDAGREQVTLSNSTKESVDLTGWKLVDKAGNVFQLSGTVKPGEPLVITMTEVTMPLNNDGDEILLLDADGVGRSRVSYAGSQAKSGIAVRFGN